MTSCADQWAGSPPIEGNAQARARKYCIAGPIPQDCHKLKQSAAHNGIVMMQMPQTCYGPQRQRYDIERASVKCSYAPWRIMQQRDDAAMRLCAYGHKSIMGPCAYVAMRMRALWGHEGMRLCAYVGSVMTPLCGYAHESIERHDSMRLCAYGHMTLGAYADMRLCAYNDMVI